MGREMKSIVTGFTYTEGPRWRDGRFYFADFYTHQVTSVLEDGSDRRLEATVPGQPSGLGWLPDGRLLIVSSTYIRVPDAKLGLAPYMDHFASPYRTLNTNTREKVRDGKILRREPDGNLTTYADVSKHISGLLNDMVVDTKGRIYVGNFGFDLMGGADIEPAPLLRVDPDGSATVVAEDLWFPNGSVITDDGTLIVNETFGNRITAFDITEDGSLLNRRVWASFGDLPARDLKTAATQISVAPDGCTLDAEGAVWVADTHNARLIRVREGGAIVDEVSPGSGVFACTLGGLDGKTLFACVAPDFHEEARKNAFEASVRTVRVDVPHAGIP